MVSTFSLNNVGDVFGLLLLQLCVVVYMMVDYILYGGGNFYLVVVGRIVGSGLSTMSVGVGWVSWLLVGGRTPAAPAYEACGECSEGEWTLVGEYLCFGKRLWTLLAVSLLGRY